MNPNLILLTLCQGLFFTNNVTLIAINGLVGLSMAPLGWMATLPVMGYVVGGALSTGLVAKSQSRWGRKVSFQLGLGVAFFSTLLAAFAAWSHNFWLLVAATVIAGYYSANGQLYRFAAAELAADVTPVATTALPLVQVADAMAVQLLLTLATTDATAAAVQLAVATSSAVCVVASVAADCAEPAATAAAITAPLSALAVAATAALPSVLAADATVAQLPRMAATLVLLPLAAVAALV
jgi:hypothetical protein